MRNFVIKWLLDQTVGSVMNIILFIVLINLLKGASATAIWDAVGKVRHSFLPGLLWRYFGISIPRNPTDLTKPGLLPHHDRPPQVPPCRVDPHVHCRPRRPEGGLWQRVRCHMGDLFESLRGGLGGFLFLLSFRHLSLPLFSFLCLL